MADSNHGNHRPDAHHAPHAGGGAHGHSTKSDIGFLDIAICAVLFVALAFGMYFALGKVVPGLLKGPVLQQILLSGGIFIGIWAVLGNMVLKPFFQLLYEREARTIGDEQAANERRKESALLEQQIEEHLRKARLEGIKERDRLIDQAKKQAEQLILAAQAQAAERFERAEAEVEKLKQQAQRELAKEAEQLAEAVISRVLTPEPRHALH